LLPGLRVAYLLAAVLLLTMLPVSQSSVLLALFVAVDLAAATLFLNRSTPQQSGVVAIADRTNLPLFRRTVPELRSRRPAAIIEAQVAWRQAGEFRRRRRDLTQRQDRSVDAHSPR
jgi:hypothetical protein